MRFVKFINLILKDGDDGVCRITGLKLGCKRMREKIILGLPLVGLVVASKIAWNREEPVEAAGVAGI